MNESDFANLSEDRIQQFEQDWLNGEPNPIADYLPDSADPRYLGTLEELVHIDLEFRWKEFHQSQSVENRPPPLEMYLERYPQLEQVKLGLIQSEFELAVRYGGHPTVQQFVDRFGQRVQGSDLRPLLKSLLSESNRTQLMRPGATIDRYQIVNEQGRGGFGAVWRATDTKLGRRIAVKQLGHRLAKDAESRRRFISEARVTAKLEHPGIVPIYDISDREDDYAYYTMRLIQGMTLAEAIEHLHALDPQSSEYELRRQKLLQGFVDACQTIDYAHSQGVVHRDLKPQNMIVGDFGETVILDWGLASLVEVQPDPTESLLLQSDPKVLTPEESAQSLRGAAIGTPAYMPPEQARGDYAVISRRSDIYSLGATLYHLITGRVPFTDGPADEMLERVKLGQLPPAWELNGRVEKSLSAIASKAMSPQPLDRYDSVGALLDDVQRFLADQPISAFRDSAFTRVARWVRKNPTKAASVALTFLFVLIAGAAGLLVNNAWQAREERRITQLQIAAERADATALSQVQSGQFESAAQLLSEAVELIGNEPRLQPLRRQLDSRRQRTQRIVNFYDLTRRAQEETFFDRPDRSAVYCQAALRELRVLSNADWWAYLPDDDLPPRQREQLRTEVYRMLLLFASMRLAESAESAFSFDMLINPDLVDPDDPVSRLIRAAGFAASQGNRFRRARGLELIEYVGAVARGDRPSVNLANIRPRNSIDGAMMGSIIDNNVPREGMGRAAVSAMLNFRNPNKVARTWLENAIKDNPEWYWLPVFIGWNQTWNGEPEQAVKTLTHAVGIRPDYWVGYQYRAWANAVAAQQPGLIERQKNGFLNAAARDIQRALDLEKNKAELYWIQALILSQSGAAVRQINQKLLQALALHPRMSDIDKGHFAGISQRLYDEAQRVLDEQRAAGNDSSQHFALQAVLKLWQAEHGEALAAARDGLAANAQDEELLVVKHLIQLDRNPEARDLDPIRVEADYLYAWQAVRINARYYRMRGDLENEADQLERAVDLARARWQRSTSRLELARNCIEAGKIERAVALIENAVAIDRAADLSVVLAAGQAMQAESVVSLCSRLQSQTAPLTRLNGGSEVIKRPALINGGFELGLSYYWSPYKDMDQTGSWTNHGESLTVAESTSDRARSGGRCLSIDLNSPVEPGSYGAMSQTVPVTAGVSYEVTFWAQADELDEGSIRMGELSSNRGTELQSIELEGGTYNWRQYHMTIVPNASELEFSIWGQGSGRALIDDIRIVAVEPR